MIRWQPRRRSGSFENDDVRRSLEMLDEILAEYEQDSDSSSNNDRSPTENGQYSYTAEIPRTQEPPPPPEEAARVIVSYLPRYQNGTEGSLSNNIDADDFPPPPLEQDLNVDACNNNNNNNNAYPSFDPLSYTSGDYTLFEEKHKISNRTATMSRHSTEDKFSPVAHRNQTQYIESRFPEFPEFQLRLTGEGSYRTDDEPEEGGYVDITTYPLEELSEDYQYRTGYLDESGDSEDRSSEECSSVIEVPLANRAGIHPIKDHYQREPVGEEGGIRSTSETNVIARGDIIPIERPEDYVKVHPKKYFEDYPADYPQVYPLDDDDCGQKGGTMFVLTGQMEGEGDFLEALPPPPAFVNAEDDVDGNDSNRDSPAFIDDADIFYDLTRSAVQQCNGDNSEDEDENDDDDSKLRTMETEESDLQSVEDDDEVEDKLGSWEEELINRHFCSLHDDEDDLIDYREDDNATPTNIDTRFEEVQKLYREGSLDGMDEAPPEFKPPPPPTAKHNGDASTTGSSPSDASDDADDDETDVRWKIPLPKGIPFVFGTTILVVNSKHQPDGILPSMAAAQLQEEMAAKASKSTPTKSEKPNQRAPALGHERKLSAEILGLEKLPDVRSLVSSFQKKEIQERAPPVVERRISQEHVGALRKELPFFTPIKPLATAPGTSAIPPATLAPMTTAKATTTAATSKPPLVAPKSSYGTPNSAVVVPAPMPPLTLSYPTHSATASLKRRAREQASKITLAGLDSRPKHTRQFSVPLEPSILLPNRTSDNDVPTLLSYRVVNGDNLPPLPMVKGATLPRPSHDPRKSGHRVAPDTTTAASVSPTQMKKDLTLRRTPPPPPPLSKGPPPKIFVEVQPSRSESSCTSSCSCLCMKHQSPCNSPVPPPMPSHKLAEIIKNDLKRSNSAPGDNTGAITDEQGRSKGRGRGFNGQLKWPKRHQSQQQQQQQQQIQQQQQQQQQQQTLTRASTSADKISNEPYDALIMEIQAAIQHRKTGQEGKEDTGSEGSISRINTPKMQAITSSPMSMSSVSDKDKSLDRKGLFRGIWRRGRSDEHKN